MAEQTYWQWLADAADAGHLYLSPEAAAKCDASCERYLEKLRLHKADARSLSVVKGYGDFQSGRDLAEIYSLKAAGGANSLESVLQSHIDVVLEMQTVFRKFFTITADNDQINASDLAADGPR